MTVESDRYLTGVEKRLAKIADPVARARAASDEITAMTAVLEKLGQLRADGVRAARETLSAQAVATKMGVTRARVYQIVQDRA